MEGIAFAQFRARMRASMDEQDRLLNQVRRSWLLPGRNREDSFVATLGFRPGSMLPVLLVHTLAQPSMLLDTSNGVRIDQLSLAGMEKYLALLKSLAMWRRGQGELPDGDALPDGPGHHAIPTPS